MIFILFGEGREVERVYRLSSDCFRPFAGISVVIGSVALLLLRLLLEAMGRGRKEAVERRNREEGTMIAV